MNDTAPTAHTALTVDALHAVLQQLHDSGAGTTPIVVNAGGKELLSVLHTAVRSRQGISYLELRIPEPTSIE